MLKKENILRLNRKMINYGMPIEKDDSGFNKVHYNRCAFINNIPDEEVTDLQLFTLLDAFLFYSKTQLAEYKDEIIEARTYYSELLSDEEKTEYKKSKNYAKKLYDLEHETPYEKEIRKEKERRQQEKEQRKAEMKRIIEEGVKVADINSDGFSIKWGIKDYEMSDFVRNYKQKKKNVRWSLNTTSGIKDDWWLVISYEAVDDFIAKLNECGYKTDKMLEVYEAYKEKLSSGNIVKKKIILERYKTGKEVVISFEGRCDKASTFVSENKPYIKWIKDDKWLIQISDSHIEKVIEFFEENNYDTSALAEYRVMSNKYFEEQSKKQESYAKEVEELEISNYDLPFNPYKHQIEGVKKLLLNKKYICGDEMGVGKTLTAILTVLSISKLSEYKNKKVKVLIICPATLRLNWKKEILTTDKNANISILMENSEYTSSDWTIISYGSVPKFVKDIENDDFIVAIFDEAHYCKTIDAFGNANSKRSEAVRSIAKNCTSLDFVFPLTGTPILTSNKDIWALLDMIEATNRWNNFYEFAIRYCNASHNGYGWNFSGCSNSLELNDILSEHMIRRKRVDVLPDLTKIRTNIPVEIPQRKFKAATEKALSTLLENQTKENFLAYAMTARRVLSSYKVKTAINLVKDLLENGESVVIASSFRDSVKAFQTAFKDKCSVIQGGMTDEQKQKAIDDFQSGKNKVCAMNIVSGGVGITLTKSHTMIIMDYEWTPSVMLQAEDRICRSGQAEPCNIYYLYGEGADIDEIFMDMFREKVSNINQVIDGEEADLNISVSSAMNVFINKVDTKDIA